MRTILVVLYVFLFLLLGLPVLGIEWIISKFNKHARYISQLRIVQWGFRCVSFLSGIKLTVKGEENVPTDQPVLYIGNHRSFFDIVVTLCQMSRSDRLHFKGRCKQSSHSWFVDASTLLPVFRP